MDSLNLGMPYFDLEYKPYKMDFYSFEEYNWWKIWSVRNLIQVNRHLTIPMGFFMQILILPTGVEF